MYNILHDIHSYWAYVVLAGLTISILFAIIGASNRGPFTDSDRKKGLFGLIPAHLQWVIGVILYFVSPLGLDNISREGMKVSQARFMFLEHPLMMIIAVVLITIGYSKSKRNGKFSNIYIFYTLGLMLILSRIPWFMWP